MNGFKLLFGALVRNGLQLLFGILVAHHALTSSQANVLPIDDMVVGIIGWCATFGWSLFQKAESKWKFLEALNARPGTDPSKIAAEAKITPLTERAFALAR